MHEPYIEFLLLVTITPFVAWFCYRAVGRLILGRSWKEWYVRRAIDVSFLGLLALAWVSFVHKPGAHISPDQRVTGDKIDKLRERTYDRHSIYYPQSEKLYQQYWELEPLMDWQYFVDNFARYVVLPTGAILFAGYSIQRRRKKKDRSPVP